MKKLHPNWSEKQCRCVLYWQNRVRKFLKNKCEEFSERLTNFEYTLLPEAMGVNVIRTALRMGLPIIPKPKEIVYKIAFMGYLRIE